MPPSYMTRRSVSSAVSASPLKPLSQTLRGFWVQAEWSVYARWPLVGKQTKMHFKETVNTDLR